jgi:hypothetical protein
VWEIKIRDTKKIKKAVTGMKAEIAVFKQVTAKIRHKEKNLI